MADKGWKRQERETARLLGGQRQPNTGRPGPDVLSERYAVEVKTRKSLPAWLTRAMAQAKANAGGRIPVTVLVLALGQGVRVRRFVLMEMDAFQELAARHEG